ncbi:MAG: hypothetical protein M0004_13560 [Actinomycetota bacterium]|nr:hypothetical protein [Actinomycetota bacterium]
MPDTVASKLPFGAVMATGAASQLAGAAGVEPLRLPLLGATIVVAVAVVLRHLAHRPCARPGAPATRLGTFTVPVGLAVIGTGIAHVEIPATAPAAAALVALAWLSTAVLIGVVVLPLLAAPPPLAAVGGAWFLAPAALLADAIGAAAVAARLSGATALSWLAAVVALFGSTLYLLVVGLAVKRIVTCGLAWSPRSAWWIAAGCGGLSAAALGRTATVLQQMGAASAMVHGFAVVAFGMWAIGCAALVPILAASVRYLLRVRHLSGRPPWPPTFSTGVFALGARQVGRLNGATMVTHFADLAAVLTLGFWVTTVLTTAPRLVHGVRASLGATHALRR